MEERGEGPPLVFLHGWCLHSGFWREQVEGLSSRFRVVTVDLPGHGKSVKPGAGLTLDFLLQNLHRSLAFLPKPFHFCGWSLGACLAVEYALAYPEDVFSLILIGGFAKFVSDPPDWAIGQPGNIVQKFREDLEADFENAILQGFHKLLFFGEEPDGEGGIQLGFALDRSILPSPEAAGELLDLICRIDIREKCRRVLAPSLLIHGDADKIASVKGALFLQRQIPNSTLVVLDGGSHAIPVTRGPEVNSAITEFVQNLKSAG